MSKVKELRFDDKVVIITGAGGGLGLAYAKAFAARGAKVVINDLGVLADGSTPDKNTAVRAADQIVASGGQAVPCFASVATVEGADAIVKAALDAYGRADVLINNAGVAHFASFSDMQPETLDLLLDVHVRGSFLVSQRVWQEMVRQGGGRIVNTLSTAGYYGEGGNSIYSMCKAALMGLTRSLALEGADVGITVNGLAPGGWSRMTESYADSLASDQRELLRKALMTEDPAAMMLWLSHENCEAKGEFYTAMSGRVSRNLVTENMGFQTEPGTLTPELIAEFEIKINKMDDCFAPESVEDSVEKLQNMHKGR